MVRIFLGMLRMLVCWCREQEKIDRYHHTGNHHQTCTWQGKGVLTIPSSACCDRRWVVTAPAGTPSVSATACSWCPSTCCAAWCSPPGTDTWWRDPWGTWTWCGTSGSPCLRPPSRQIAFYSPKRGKWSNLFNFSVSSLWLSFSALL